MIVFYLRAHTIRLLSDPTPSHADVDIVLRFVPSRQSAHLTSGLNGRLESSAGNKRFRPLRDLLLYLFALFALEQRVCLFPLLKTGTEQSQNGELPGASHGSTWHVLPLVQRFLATLECVLKISKD